jgi:lysophospholipase L1-like esterase
LTIIITKSYYQGLPGRVGDPGVSGSIKFLSGFTIPASGSVAVPAAADSLGNGQEVLVALGGISGNLKRLGATYTFTRTSAGSPINVASDEIAYSISPISSVGGDLVSASQAYAYEFLDTAGNAAVLINLDGTLLLPSQYPDQPNLISRSDDGAFEIVDQLGNAGIKLTQTGTLLLPSEFPNQPIEIGAATDGIVFAIADAVGKNAFQVNSDGTVKIGLLQADNFDQSTSPTTTVAAWNENNSFWQGYAPISGATSSYDRVFAGSATSNEADDFCMRQNYWCQHAGSAVKAYFDHSSDHTPTYVPGSTFLNAAPNMQIGWGVGLAADHIAGVVSSIVRGTIKNQRRPTVPGSFFGWSDAIVMPVTADQYLSVTTTQNISGTNRLSGGAGATGTATGAARKGGFLASPSTRWSAGISSPAPTLDTVNYDLDGCAGFRFLAVKTPIDRLICVASDSIARGIYYTTQPAPTNWPMLLDRNLRSNTAVRSAVWHQGSGGGVAYQQSINDQYLDRIVNCTHLVITLGANDINQSRAAAQIQADITKIATVAKQAGAKVFVATIAPWTVYTLAQNTQRNSYNTWVRSNPFEGFFDFDLAIRNPATPNVLPPAYDGGDGIHPNDAGHVAMLSAINVNLFN